ncbi:hypothetical protein Tco_0145982 [Tanacetum coccineum]
MSSDAIKQLITQCVADAMTTYEANRNNGYGSHNEASTIAHMARGCMYKEFLNCQPCNFKGTRKSRKDLVTSKIASRMLLYIKGKENEKLIVDSVLNGPFKYGIVTILGTQTTPVTVRERTYDELTDTKKIREGCDIKATNIMLQGLPQDIYNLINHLQPEWSKFVTDVKLAKDLQITNFDHLYGYLRQHEAHTEESQYHQQPSLFAQQHYSPPVTVSPMIHQQSSLAPNVHQPSVAQQLFYQPPDTHHSSKQGYASNGVRNNAIGSSFNINGGTYIVGPTKVIHCYNYQEEGHVARKCTKPKRPRNSAWFKEKAMLAEALESRVALDEEQMAFLADNRDTVTTGQASQELVTTVTFQTDDLDAFDYDCDEAPSASAILFLGKGECPW